ncbi:hypothetical protein [Sodalis-like endosymbiont of Proechinophthirus fluctus]|nr:hypothetical protein [Sodalis-like endosymbiont of Proechinophthirus fluctus]
MPDEDNFVSLYDLNDNLVVAAHRMRKTGVLLINIGEKLGIAKA